MIGAELGYGAGQGVGAMLGGNLMNRRLAKDLNPMRAALEQTIGEQVRAGVPLSPQQQMVASVIGDDRKFARLAGSPARALELGGLFEPVAPKVAHHREYVIRAGSELAQRYGIDLQPGDTATVKIPYDQNDREMPGFEIEQFNRASEGGDEERLMFGTGLRGRSLEYATNLSTGYAEKALTPEDERKLYTSVVELLRPEVRVDPDTGLEVRRPGAIPPYTRRALMSRPEGAQFLAQVEQSWEAGVAPPLELPGATSAPRVSPEDAQAAAASAASTPTIPPEVAMPPQEQGRPSLWELAGTGDVTGPVPSIARGFHRLPGSLLGQFPAETEAGTYVNGIKERLIDGLRRNPRYAEGEAERLFKAIDIKPGAFDSAGAMKSRVIGFDDVLEQIENEMQEVVTERRALVSGETRQHAMDTLQIVRNTRQILTPPRARSTSQAQEMIRTGVPGSKFLVRGHYEPDGRVIVDPTEDWIVVEVEPR
jgi:hypothetical protein